MSKLERVVDRLQWTFDLAYGLVPRALKAEAVSPLLIGHRGVFQHPEIKENTISAFDLAISRGAGIEFDLHLTKDCFPIVHHDETLKRVHDLPYAISKLTLAELKELAPEVPTLDEVLVRYSKACPQYFIEPKVKCLEDIDRMLFKIKSSLDAQGLMQKATLLSTKTLVLDRARALVPQIAKVIVFFVDYRSCLEYAFRCGDTGLAGWYFTFPEQAKEFLAARLLHAGIGQIDHINTHNHFCNQGFSYHFTNRIDRLVSVHPSLNLAAKSLDEKVLVAKNNG